MSAITNDTRDNLQFINPARYEDLRHSWEQDILSMFNRPKAAPSLCSAGAKQIVPEHEPVVSKYEQMKESVPIHLKAVLTIREAAAYTSIGINKIDALLRSPNCPFVLFVGTKKLVKRKEFEQFISNKLVI